MSLPYDTARCEGFYIASKMLPMEGLNPDCIDCLRRTSPGRDQWQTYIAPHDGEGPCPSRIGPRDVPETDFGFGFHVGACHGAWIVMANV